jgi:hypothetical protein
MGMMMKAWMIKIQEGIQKARMEINQAVGLVFTAERIMMKGKTRRKMENMELEGIGIGKIGQRTE